jgi:hypothetical protein
MMRHLVTTVVLAISLFVVPTLACAEEVVIQFRSLEDPQGTPDLAVCADAPFVANVVTAAKLFAVRTRASDGHVVGKGQVEIGSGTGCLRVTDVTFPPFTSGPIYGDFTIDGRTMRISGVCTLTSNDVPLRGVVLAGCATSVVEAPDGFAGGVASSNSVFNPFRLPGFSTGSLWTVRLYAE